MYLPFRGKVAPSIMHTPWWKVRYSPSALRWPNEHHTSIKSARLDTSDCGSTIIKPIVNSKWTLAWRVQFEWRTDFALAGRRSEKEPSLYFSRSSRKGNTFKVGRFSRNKVFPEPLLCKGIEYFLSKYNPIVNCLARLPKKHHLMGRLLWCSDISVGQCGTAKSARRCNNLRRFLGSPLCWAGKRWAELGAILGHSISVFDIHMCSS